MDRFKYWKIFFIILSFLLFAVPACTKVPEKRGSIALTIETIGETSTERYSFLEIPLAALIDINHTIKESNGFIRCIDDVCADSSYTWEILLDWKPALGSVNSLKVRSGDHVTLRLRR